MNKYLPPEDGCKDEMKICMHIATLNKSCLRGTRGAQTGLGFWSCADEHRCWKILEGKASLASARPPPHSFYIHPQGRAGPGLW